MASCYPLLQHEVCLASVGALGRSLEWEPHNKNNIKSGALMARLGAQIIDLRAQIIKSCTQNVCFFLHDMSQTPEILDG